MGARRWLVIDGARYGWALSHGHAEIDGEPRCMERLAAWLEGDPRGALHLRFIDGEGGRTTTGQGWGGHSGRVLVDGLAYNLHRPALAAGLIRAGLASGWQPGRGRLVVRDDGYALLAAIGPSLQLVDPPPRSR